MVLASFDGRQLNINIRCKQNKKMKIKDSQEHENQSTQAYLGWQICSQIIEQNGGILDYQADSKDWFVADRTNKGYSVKFSMLMSHAFSKDDINNRLGFDITG